MSRATRPVGLDHLAPASIVATAILWGSTFFVLKDSVTRIPPTDLLALRFTLTTLILWATTWRRIRLTRPLVIQGTVMGFFFASGQLLQTIGLAFTSASISGFLTGLYVVFTALIQAVVIRVQIRLKTWVSVGLATAGLLILTIVPGTRASLGIGEVLTLLCALSYAGHIVYTGRVSAQNDAIGLATVQSTVLTLACWLAALSGGIQLPAQTADWWALGYLAIPCGVVTIILQIWAQARMEATRAAIIMSSEPIWAAAFAIAAGQESLAWQTPVGGGGMVAAMVLSSLAEPAVRPARDRRDESSPARSGVLEP